MMEGFSSRRELQSAGGCCCSCYTKRRRRTHVRNNRSCSSTQLIPSLIQWSPPPPPLTCVPQTIHPLTAGELPASLCDSNIDQPPNNSRQTAPARFIGSATRAPSSQPTGRTQQQKTKTNTYQHVSASPSRAGRRPITTVPRAFVSCLPRCLLCFQTAIFLKVRINVILRQFFYSVVSFPPHPTTTYPTNRNSPQLVTRVGTVPAAPNGRAVSETVGWCRWRGWRPPRPRRPQPPGRG